jgi:hypothetical protein
MTGAESARVTVAVLLFAHGHAISGSWRRWMRPFPGDSRP